MLMFHGLCVDHVHRSAIQKQWIGYYEVPAVPAYHHRFSQVRTSDSEATLDPHGNGFVITLLELS